MADITRSRTPPVTAAAVWTGDEGEKKMAAGDWRIKIAAAAAAVRPKSVLMGFLLTLPILVFLFSGRGSLLSPNAAPPAPAATGLAPAGSSKLGSTAAASPPPGKTIGGPTFRDAVCLSRYRSSLYWKSQPSSSSPSVHLIQRLRRYEVRHKKCGPKTKLYRAALEQLNSGKNGATPGECQYIVWYPCNGLGNRMLTLGATFLYALLTDRILLAQVPEESDNLFCEPFPGSSWLLPTAFPHYYGNPYIDLHANRNDSYLNMLKSGVIRYDDDDSAAAAASSLPAYVYLHLEQSNVRLSDNVFCDRDQRLLAKFNWMLLKSDSYFLPSLFLTPMFQQQLELWFPERETVFHHLGRYLFHPTNQVWGMIERYYSSYLAGADERVGIQIRIFPEKPITFENMYEQVVQCIREHQLLPEIASSSSPANDTSTGKRKALLLTSLYSGYYDKIRAMYYENPTATGDVVSVFQPSQEKEQKTQAQAHNQKALAEIFLLSYCEKIVISAWSTFGYVAHSLAGTRPWILLRPPWNQEKSDVGCVRSASPEPCQHSPPKIGCGAGVEVDPSDVVPHVRHCEDVSFGLKLYS